MNFQIDPEVLKKVKTPKVNKKANREAMDLTESLGIAYKESTTGHDIDPDGVAHPGHYNVDPSGVECIDIVRHRNFNIGSAIKYLWRGGLKDEAGDLLAAHIKDLKKAIFYINDEITRLEKLK